MTNPASPEPSDPLLAALRALPVPAADPAAAARAQRAARAAYVRRFGPRNGSDVALGFGRVAMPVFLALVVGLYMSWAFASATALVQ
jgi:hypothetical protein